MGINEVIVEYVVNTKYEDLHEKVVEQAKVCTLDLLECALGGCKSDIGKMVIDQIKGFGKHESTIIGDGTRVPCTRAAFANAVTADILDFEDTHSGIGYSGATIIPAALALGECVGASGRIS